MRGLAAILLAALAASCVRRQPVPLRSTNASVVLISIDTLRADHLPLYGYRGVDTPNIDGLASDGVVFDQVWSHCPMTLPSHVSMLTGELPTTHGVRNNLGFRYDAAKHPSISQRLHENGYATGAAVSAYVLRGETGLRNAFDWYEDGIDASPGGRFTEYQRSGFVTTALAEKWLDSVASRPFFLFLHLYEPHVPYDPPEPFRTRYAANAYDGEIATADAIIGQFVQHLKRRGVYDKAIVILTSDHGEGLGDHGEMQHSILLYTELIRVPLVIKLPHDAQRGTRSKTPAALVDLAPTIASLTGLPVQKSDGIDLFAAGALKRAAPRSIYSETIYPYVQLGWSDLRSIASGALHYIDGPRPEMYDIASDPHERNDVIAAHRREAAQFRAALAEFPPPTTGDIPISAADAAKLAALGYIGVAHARPDPRTLPNPRDVIGTMEEIRVAYQLAADHKYGEARTQFASLLARNPHLVDVRTRLADMELQLGRSDDAIREYKDAIAASGVVPSEIVASLGEAYLQAGRLDDARKAAEAATGGSPDKARRLEVRIALARRDVTGAATIADHLPDTAGDLLLRAQVRGASGDFAGALQLANDAEARAKSDGEQGVFGLSALRGDALARLGRIDEAVSAYQHEIKSYPNDRIAYARLAVLYFAMGDRASVDRTLEQLVRANPERGAYELAAHTLESVEDVSGARRWRARMPH